jgi:hydroxymethylpyrimidine kinase/phosphomethylpyrimidine kinase
MKYNTNVLSIAGSDSSAGAGIQADLKTITSLSAFGLTVITLITAQNTTGVQNVFSLPLDIIEQQIDSIFSDIVVHSVKIGALYNSEIIQIVEKKLIEYKAKNIVLDPVIFSKNMSLLLQQEAVNTMKKLLLPLATILTPNIPEAEILSGMKIVSRNDMVNVGLNILSFGCNAVLIKGGHLEIDEYCIDCLVYKGNDGIHDVLFFDNKRIKTKNTHGTGCTLSAAIATFLGQGNDIKNSISKAKQYISKAINGAIEHKLGKGCGPVDHFYKT